jgi:hypothetical protein
VFQRLHRKCLAKTGAEEGICFEDRGRRKEMNRIAQLEKGRFCTDERMVGQWDRLYKGNTMEKLKIHIKISIENPERKRQIGSVSPR